MRKGRRAAARAGMGRGLAIRERCSGEEDKECFVRVYSQAWDLSFFTVFPFFFSCPGTSSRSNFDSSILRNLKKDHN